MEQQLCQLALDAGEYARKAVIEGYGLDEKTSYKDVATDVDKKTEAFIKERLRTKYPGCSIVGEESGSDGSLRGLCFIIDPIDGTTNLVCGANTSAISIGCCKDGVPFAGVVYNMFTDEMWSAEKGCGSHYSVPDTTIATAIMGREHSFDPFGRIRVDNVPTDALNHSVGIFGTSPYHTDKTHLDFLIAEELFHHVMDVRRPGACALDLAGIASGRAACYEEAMISPWDCCAGAIIIQEAGGVIERWDGKPLDFSGKNDLLAACSREVADEVHRIIDRVIARENK